MPGGYVAVDKDKAFLAKNVVAVIAGKGKRSKSKIIFEEGSYDSVTTAGKIAKRLEGGEKKDKRLG